jgi:hypothetical protein
MKTSKISKAKENPTKVFDSPSDVVVADLPTRQKAEILENWENEAHQLQAAADESMIGGEPSRLAEVRQAIDKLKKEESSKSEQ